MIDFDMDKVHENLLEVVRDAVDWEDILRRKRAILCGLSGGPDSVALCDILHRLSEKMDLTLHAAHLNHGLRGTDADRDEEFVREFCAARDIELDVERANVRGYITSGDRSVEMAARSARYEFFGRAAARTGIDILALGHTADDRIENLLMRLFRGSGGRGLGSLRTVRFQGGMTIVRPLLGVFRSVIIDYLESMELEYRVDRTNLDETTDRGRIRNFLLPELLRLAEESGWEGTREALARSAALLAEDEAFLDSLVHEHRGAVQVDEEGGLHLHVSELASLPSPILARLILSSIETVDSEARPERQHIRCIINMIKGERTGACDIPGGLRAELVGDQVLVRKPPDGSEPEPVEIALDQLPETVRFGPAEIEISILKNGAKRTHTSVEPSQGGIWIAPPEGCKSIVIRAVRPGDRMAPLGMQAHTKKISDIFIDNRIPRESRITEPIIESRPGGEILGLPGLGIISDFAKITEETKTVIKIVLRRPLAA